MDVVIHIDKLIAKSDNRIILELNRGSLTNTDLILHNNIVKYIKEELSKNKKFLDGKIEKIEEKLRERAQSDTPTPSTPKSTEDILNSLNEPGNG